MVLKEGNYEIQRGLCSKETQENAQEPILVTYDKSGLAKL